ncbi:hypothetical protein BH23ACI1_BH23ACI1_09880 [soil metagenome]|nr:hypothetical protein [Acidobacteriota bacterium]
MATSDAATAGSAGPRPALLIALGLTVLLALAIWFWPANSAGPVGRPSNAARPAQPGSQDDAIDPAALDVRLEALEARHGVAQDGDRNPFRFQPRPAPVATPPSAVDIRPVPQQHVPETPPGPPQPPPIPMKFIGIIEPQAGDRVAVFSDCRVTPHAREGDVVLGQYRLVRIGVESVVMEYVDGQGRTTIRLQGQECVGK